MGNSAEGRAGADAAGAAATTATAAAASPSCACNSAPSVEHPHGHALTWPGALGFPPLPPRCPQRRAPAKVWTPAACG